MGRIAILDRIEYEYEYRDAEYEYDEEARTKHWTEVLDRAFLICVKPPHCTRSMRNDYEVQGLQVTVATVF